jgi:hypothetical protein
MPKGEVLFNRLFRDRDVAQRDEWIDRGPGEKDGSMS